MRKGEGEGVQGLTYATKSTIDMALLMLMLAACLQGEGVSGASAVHLSFEENIVHHSGARFALVCNGRLLVDE